MPPGRPKQPPHERDGSGEARRAGAAPPATQARLERFLARWIAAPEDRAYVLRVLQREGPPHHRSATEALLLLLEAALEASGLPPGAAGSGVTAQRVPVPLRLPPHVSARLPDDERNFPLAMPTAELRRVVDDPAHAAALTHALLDGPPHHALANALTVQALDALIARLRAPR